DVRVPVEPEMRVEGANLAQDVTPHREAVALDGVHVARRCLVELTQVFRGDAERPRDPYAPITERCEQRRDQVSGRLDGRVEEDRDLAAGTPQPQVDGVRPTQPLARRQQPRLDLQVL